MLKFGYPSSAIGPPTLEVIGRGVARREFVLVDHPDVPDRLVLGEVFGRGDIGQFEVIMHGLKNGSRSIPIHTFSRDDFMSATLRDLNRAHCFYYEACGKHLELPYEVVNGRLIATDDWPIE